MHFARDYRFNARLPVLKTLYASTLVLLSPSEVQKVVFGRVQAFYEWYYLYIKDL